MLIFELVPVLLNKKKLKQKKQNTSYTMCDKTILRNN